MIFLNFPLSGDIRWPLLVIEWIFAFTTFELGLIFVLRYRKPEKDMRSLQELGYASLLFGFSIMWFFFIVSDYYVSNEILSPFYIWKVGSERGIFLNFGYFSLMIGALFCIFFMEKYNVYLFKRFFFTFTFLILIIIFMVVFLFDIFITQDLSIAFWPLFILFFVIYFKDFSKKAKSKGSNLFGVIKFLAGFIILAIGFLFTTDMMMSLIFPEIRFIGGLLQLTGIILISYNLMTLPLFSEIGWQEQIEDVFLLDASGICIYHKAIGDALENVDDNLVSGYITTINIMLRELTATAGVSVIKKKGKTIIIYPRKLVTGVIFSKKDLNIIKKNLKDFVQKFETVYWNVLEKWDGNLNIFTPTENIANEIFSK